MNTSPEQTPPAIVGGPLPTDTTIIVLSNSPTPATAADPERPKLPEPSEIPAGSFTIKCNPEIVLRGKKHNKKWVIVYRLSVFIGGNRISKMTYDGANLEKEGKKWIKTLNTREALHSTDGFKDLQRCAFRYEECVDMLTKHGMTPQEACALMAELLEQLDIEGIRKLVAVHLSALRRVKPLLIREGIEEYRKIIFPTGMPVTEDDKREEKCLTLFGNEFGGNYFHLTTAQEIQDFRTHSSKGQDLRNKILYYLRALFSWARDMKQALPPGPTVCDAIKGKRPKNPTPEIYSVPAIKLLCKHAVDREMVLALLLTTFHFHRQEEAEQMRGEFFIRDRQGTPYEIKIPREIAKTEKDRIIPIALESRALFALLVPLSGRIFKTKHPFNRLHRLARAFGIIVKKNGFRHSCVSYRIAAGMPRPEAAANAGHDELTQETFYFVEVPQPMGFDFETIRFEIDRVRELPPLARVNFKRLAKGIGPVPDLNDAPKKAVKK